MSRFTLRQSSIITDVVSLVREPQTTLVKGRLEGWAKVRVSGSTEWERLWVVVSTISSGPTGSLDAGTGRPGSPNSTLSKRNRLSSFLSGGNKNSQILSSDGSAIGSGPSITMYRTNKTKDRRRPLYTVTRVTQAFGVYPERPEIINQSTLFKLEALIKDEQVSGSFLYLFRCLTCPIQDILCDWKCSEGEGSWRANRRLVDDYTRTGIRKAR